MKTIALLFFLPLGFLLADPPAQPPTDWTVQGKTYHNVVVGKIDADQVHITYEGGVGAVDISDLAPDLQKQLGFDPQKAAAAQQQRAYEAEISDLKAEVARLQDELSRYKSAAQAQSQTTAASATKPSRKGYLYFYNDLLNQSGMLHDTNPSDHGFRPTYQSGPFAGMTEGDAKAYAQRQWAALSEGQKLAYEQNAETYGPGPDPDVPKPPGQYAPAPPTHQYQVTPTGGGGATVTGY